MISYLYCLLVILIYVWIYKRWNERHFIALIKHFPHKKYQIVLGFGPLWGAKVLLKKFIEFAGQGQNVIQYSGPQILFITSDPETIKDILTSKLCISKPDVIYSGVVHSLGDGLITTHGKYWTKQRRVANGSFKNSNMISFLPTFNDKIYPLFDTIDECIANNSKTQLLYVIREYTLRTAFATITGRDLDKANMDIRDSAKKKALEFSSEFTSNFIYLLRIIRLFARMTKYKDAWAFLSFLNSLLTEAFESSSSTTYNALLLLAMHPEIQQRAYDEICEVFPEDDEGNFTMTYDHLNKLPYLGMIANEVLRLWPVIPQVGRTIEGGSLKLSSGVVLPEGLNVLIDMYSLQRNKEILGNDADKFNPDHFLPGNNETRHPYAYLPFTKGIRFCIGMRYAEINIKLTLARLLKRYKFSTTAKLEDIQFENHIVMQILNHPEVTVQRRG